MIAPRITIHGTHRQDLEDEYRAAMDAIDAAIDRVVAITVHGRDYDNDLRKAETEKRAMVTRLAETRRELHDVVVAIQLQTRLL